MNADALLEGRRSASGRLTRAQAFTAAVPYRVRRGGRGSAMFDPNAEETLFFFPRLVGG